MSDTVAAFLDECTDLDALVAMLDEQGWARDTPAKGWTVAHQIAHLAWTDEVALLAATAPDEFAREVEAALRDVTGHVDEQAAKGAAAPPSELLARWRTGRDNLADALRSVPEGTKLPWFGPPMSARSMATARLMETWAHGQDVADALGVQREPTTRLRDVCHLGVRTRDFAYLITDREVPSSPFRIVLTAPGGEEWTWGDALRAPVAEVQGRPRAGSHVPRGRLEAQEPGSVTGSAQDFCLVVTQRRDPADTDLVATGEAAHWLTFAQAFAGPPKGAAGAQS